jgi:hypothetical protein
MVATASIVDEFATGVGLLAGLIAVGGFLAHIRPALSGASETDLRGATVTGGVVGLVFGLFVIVLSAILDRVNP